MDKKMLYVSRDGSSYSVLIQPEYEIVTISHTDSPVWNVPFRRKAIAHVHDTGDGISIMFSESGETIVIDYSEFAALEMLLTALKHDAPWAKQYGFEYDRYELKVD